MYWSTVPFVDLYLFLSARVVSRRPGISPAERRLWRAVTAQMFLIATGDAVQAVTIWIDPTPAAVTTVYTALCNVVGLLPVLVTLLTFRAVAAGWTVRMRYSWTPRRSGSALV